FGILGAVVAALVLAGLGTLVVAKVRSQSSTASELRRQARELAGGLEASATGVDASPDTPAERRQLNNQLRIINAARRVIHVDGIDILVYRNGATDQALPVGLDVSDLDLDALTRGGVQSGTSEGKVYAAAATRVAPRGSFILVVLTRQADL